MASAQASKEDLRSLNVKLWQQVHSLELKIRLEAAQRKRDEKQFRKKLVRLSKYLSMVGGLSPAQVRAKLLQSNESEMQTG